LNFLDTPAFTDAQPLTVRIRGVMIQDDEDWGPRGNNDIALVSSFQFGCEPPVQRLHYMQQGVALGWHGSFFHDTIVSVRDWCSKVVTIRLQVYDMDGVSEGLIEKVQTLSKSIAVAFPQVAPYAGAAASFGPELLKLIDHLDDHDRLLDERIKLEIAPPGTGHWLIQPGYFYCFRQAVDEGYAVDQDLRVIAGDGGELTGNTYAVLEVARMFYERYEWEIDQKVAKLLAELNRKGQSGKAPIEFLRETLDAYTKYRRLHRARELMNKPNLTDDERSVLNELRQDQALRPFLLPLP